MIQILFWLVNWLLRSAPTANSEGTKGIQNTKNDDSATPSNAPSVDSVKKPRRVNEAGLKLIKQSEGLRLKAYKDVVGVLTIGYGSTGSHVTEGLEITEERAEALLLEDLVRFEKGVEDLVNTVVVTENQFSALVSFSFNLGLGALKTSTLLRKLLSGDPKGASAEFVRWNKAGGKTFPGLTKRREAERDLFLS